MATFNMTFLSRDKPFDMSFGSFVQQERVVVPNPYEGNYTVTPKKWEQVLPTQYKTMSDDLTVREIPYAETTNDYGTTVVIAS